MYCFIMALVDVLEDACQHGAPLALPQQLWMISYMQGSVVDSSSEMFQVPSVVQIH